MLTEQERQTIDALKERRDGGDNYIASFEADILFDIIDRLTAPPINPVFTGPDNAAMASAFNDMAPKASPAAPKAPTDDDGIATYNRALIKAVAEHARTEALEEAAALFESIGPASDDERLHGNPGAGAMGAVLEYRNAIRALPKSSALSQVGALNTGVAPVIESEQLADFLQDQFYHHTKSFAELAEAVCKSFTGGVVGKPKADALISSGLVGGANG